MMVGCATTIEPIDPICPPRPEFIPISIHLQQQMPAEAVDIADYNIEIAKEAIKNLEALAGCQ